LVLKGQYYCKVFNKLLKNLVEMIGKIAKTPQLELFKTPLKQFLKDNHELILLLRKINWDLLEQH